MKSFVDGQERLLEVGTCPELTNKVGTVIKVTHLFHLLHVRQYQCRRKQEKMLVKEMIRRTSMLHHHVSFLLLDECGRALYKLPSQPSVSKRIISLHGLGMLTRLKMFSYRENRWSLEGLLCLPHDCHATTDFQYFYLNNRWIRGRDPIIAILNQMYGKLLGGDCGPRPMHSTSAARFPVFVLHLSLPREEFDILVEPDKSMPIYSNERQVLAFVHRALVDFFRKTAPSERFADLVAAIDDTTARIVGNESLYDTHRQAIEEEEDATDHEGQETFQIDFVRQDKLDAIISRPGQLQDLFQEAFPSRNFTSTKELPIQTSESSSEGLTLESFALNAVASGAVAVTISRSKNTIAAGLPIDVETDLPSPEAGDNISSSPSPIPSISRPISTQCEDSTVLGKRATLGTRTDRKLRALENENEVTSGYRNVRKERVSERPVEGTERLLSLDKDLLQRLTFIGQVDAKYLVTIDATTGVLVALDQHAVDERIRFEKVCQDITEKIISIPRRTAWRRHISEEDAWILASVGRVVNSWGFHFSVDAQRLEVTATPCLLGETLTPQDLLEFVQFIRQNKELPVVLLKPPAIHRILASKACRQAITFNTTLSNDVCEQLLLELANTERPFQCAHGRPSVVPIADISAVLRGPLSSNLPSSALANNSQQGIHQGTSLDQVFQPSHIDYLCRVQHRV